MNKQEERKYIHNKYQGKCAYCGNDITIKDMQVDHLHPVRREYIYDKLKRKMVPTGKMENPEHDNLDNKIPACRKCNHYKHSYTLEEFRNLMNTLHLRLEKHYINTVAIKFGMITVIPFDGLFYFEKVEKCIPPLPRSPTLFNDE